MWRAQTLSAFAGAAATTPDPCRGVTLTGRGPTLRGSFNASRLHTGVIQGGLTPGPCPGVNEQLPLPYLCVPPRLRPRPLLRPPLLLLRLLHRGAQADSRTAIRGRRSAGAGPHPPTAHTARPSRRAGPGARDPLLRRRHALLAPRRGAGCAARVAARRFPRTLLS